MSTGPRSLKQTEAVERAALLAVTSYDVSLDLDRGDETFSSKTTIELTSEGGPTFLDVQPADLRSVTLNGRPVDVALHDRGRLPLDTTPGSNQVVVDAEMRFRNDGEGLHRAVDPADGQHYVYAMPFLDAAPSIFGCFDQPDLKAPFTLHVRAPSGWTVIGNSPATEVEPGRWELATTHPLATYHVGLIAGPYHVVRSEHDGIPLSLSARRSIGQHLDADAEELFTMTAQCFDEFHRLFGIRYPFGDYHQAFVPEFNAGAMESPGCVTFRDSLVFQSRVTRTFRVVRATTLAHEMAHMWFGDIVTPVWWDDLWLNESFAEYMGSRVTADVTQYDDAWVHDAHVRHQWGLTADQRPSTHPVAANGAADAASALQDFDGISYAKGASIIKQLNARLGDDVFFRGASDHFEKHRFGNATMADLLDAWDRAGAGDLSGFADSWLRTAGPDRIELDRGAGVVRRTPLDGHPADRAHTFGIATADPDSPGSWRSQPLVVEAATTAVDLPPGPAVLDPQVQTWAVTLLDPETLASLPEMLPATHDGLIRASIWNSVLNAFHLALLDPEQALAVLEAGIPVEDSDDAVTMTLMWAKSTLVPVAVDPVAALARVHAAAAARVATSPAGSTLQLAAFQGQLSASTDVKALRSRLSGRDGLPDGMVVDLELRWRILVRLAELGAVDRDELAAALATEPTAVSQVEHATAVASLPDAEAKAWAWQRFIGEVAVPNHELEGVGLGFWRHGQDDLTDAYVARYFDELGATAQVRIGWTLLQTALGFYPRTAIADDTVQRARALLVDDDLDPALRRAVSDATDDLEHQLAVVKKFGAA
jgi:aminopeptidase N